ncbi:alpha/beta fold hydrolase [Spirillospora sp. CA-128828]|uniref:alpha/beta fold hydrolase n=1 Tax=Spirillospora sp. CA-128828 TaxID=3240033 RepID=UPI003D91967D
MPYFELTGGVPLYYEDHGNGAPVVLLHGWTMNSTFWGDNVPALAAGNRVITVDLRGHGSSGKTPEGHTLGQYARDVRALIEHLELDHVALVGWSMGTDVILWYVHQYGCDRLRSAVFVDQSPRFLNADDWDFPLLGNYTRTDLAVFAQTVRHARPDAIKPFIAACFAEPPTSDVIDAVYAETTKTPTEAALSVWMDMAHADLRPLLPQVTVPVLLAYGRRSKVFPGDLAGLLAEALPDARSVRFEHSGHVPFAEEAERFNEVLAEFLAKPE